MQLIVRIPSNVVDDIAVFFLLIISIAFLFCVEVVCLLLRMAFGPCQV